MWGSGAPRARLRAVSPTIIALVLASAVAHAYWNFLLKRNAGTEIFVGLSKVAEALVFAPVFVALALPGMPLTGWTVVLVVVATLGVLGNYASLTMAYRHGDLSFAYPVSRGATLLFLPLLAMVTIGEHVNAVGVVGLVAILAGVLALSLPDLSWSAVAELGAHLRHRAVLWALAVAFNNAIFTLWDKYAVRTLAPFTYMYAYTSLTAASYAAYIWRKHPHQAIAAEWRGKWWAIAQVGVLNTVSYVLILFALRTGVSSYIIGFRQLSIAVGVVFGWRLLGETLSPARRLGVTMIVGGCVLVAFAR
jgi:drug/metabolite transporter (DMT)-like permease